MSDLLDKVEGLDQIPIFPLPLVLLPNELLPLHIFEDRYRAMLADIQRSRNIFGVILSEPKDPFIDRPPAGSVGTAALVRDAEILPDGRSNIITLGLVRFRLIDYADADQPYLVGNVEFFEDTSEPGIEDLAVDVLTLFDRMAKAAFKLGGGRGGQPQIRHAEPEALSFLITAAFNFDNARKQALIEMTSTGERLAALKVILDSTVLQMEESAEIQTLSKTNGHSKEGPRH